MRRPSLRRERGSQARRLFFATDLHASEACFRKFLAAARVYEVDLLVLGGDVMGKALVPLVEDAGRGERGERDGCRLRGGLGEDAPLLDGEAEIEEFTRRVADEGSYAVRVSRERAEQLRDDPGELHVALIAEARRRTEAWAELAESRLAGQGTRCFVTGGNDDPEEVLEPLRRPADSPLVFCEGEVEDLGEGISILSLGYSNHTPWKTPRELSEEELLRCIRALAAQAPDPRRTVFNLHVPPIGTGLDRCPLLDTGSYPPAVVRVGGEVQYFDAGSTAVREALEEFQPFLSLHGHIHESRGAARLGRTLALNPGSEYSTAALKGAIATLDVERPSFQFTTG
jgi:Icc-related predicted phosphoesterase